MRDDFGRELYDTGIIIDTHTGPCRVWSYVKDAIGTGPWPDDADTGDPPDSEPPSTLPMGLAGWVPKKKTVATHAGAVKAIKAAWTPGTIFSLNRDAPVRRLSDDYRAPHVGMTCRKCNMCNEHAEPNQEDGTYVCYECR